MRLRKNILVLTQWSYKDPLIQAYTLPYVDIIAAIIPPGSRIYLVTFEQACNATPDGCTPGDLYTPRIESDWTRVRIQDDKRDLDSLVGDIAIAQDPLLPGAVGRVEMRGTGWSAKNVGTDLVTPGQRCRVERTEGLMLLVRGEGG